MKNTAINLYNPAQKEKETLINEFVIRGKEFRTIIEDVQNSKMDVPEQHYLIVGQRGMGKTTLLWRILYAIEDNPKLNKKLIPVIFGEEQYNIFSLSQFWEETAIYLGNKYTEYGSLYDKMVEHEENENYSGISFEILEKALKTNKQHIVVLMDNLGYLLDKISEKEAHFFRKTLMTSNIIRIIATSSVVLEHTFRYDKPFFEFFYEMRLEPLDRKASIDLLRTLAEVHGKTKEINALIENEPNRIEALRRITGGVPRTMALLFEIFVDNRKGDSFEYLQELTDKVTALYKHRMDGLKPQQQQILDALARAWEPIGTQEILKKSKLYRKNIQSNQISAQLKQLSDNQLIEVVHLTGKKKAYRIRERFFNIWYLMRYGRKNSKEQILFLIQFFEDWCNVPDLISMSKEMQQSFQDEKDGFSSQAAYYKSLALLETRDLPAGEKNTLRESAVKYLIKANSPDLANQLITQTSNDAEEIFNKALKAHFRKKFSEAEKYYLDAIKEGFVEASNNLAVLYADQGKSEEAEKYFLYAIEKKVAEASFNLAMFYENHRRTNEAEKYYLLAIEKGNKQASNNLAMLYENQRNNTEAEKYYLQAIEKGNIEAINNLALFYSKTDKFEEAEKYHMQAVKKGTPHANFNLALLNEIQGKTKDAEKHYLKAIENGFIEGIINLAMLYKKQGKIEDAKKYYLQAIEKGEIRASFNLAILYKEQGETLEAVKYYKVAYENGISEAGINLANIYREIGSTEKAEKYLMKAVENGYVEASFNLAFLYLEKNQFNSASKIFQQSILDIKKEDEKRLQQIIIAFMSYKQYETIYQIFKEFNLKEEFLPLYYALMYFMQDKFPNEYLKTNPEIKETVDEIIEVVKKEQERIFS